MKKNKQKKKTQTQNQTKENSISKINMKKL